MKALFRRLTWGFLPRGWGRLVFFFLPLFILGIYRILDYIDYQDLLKRVAATDNFFGTVGSFSKARPFDYYDILECLIISSALSLIASWVADGFKKK